MFEHKMFVFLLKVIGTITRQYRLYREFEHKNLFQHRESKSTKKIFANACRVLFSVNELNLINAQKKKTALLTAQNEVLEKQISNGTVVPNQDWGYIDKNSGRN